MTTSGTSLVRRALVVVVVSLFVAVLTAPTASSAPDDDGTPRLRLRQPSPTVTLWHGKGQRVQLNTGALLASMDAPFELRIERPDYLLAPVISQVEYHSGGTEVTELPDGTFTSWYGLENFFTITVTKNGEQVAQKQARFCPNGYERQRVADGGPAQPVYPEYCGANVFTKGMVWGLEQDWATLATGWEGPRVKLADGKYEITTTVSEPFKTLFGVSDADATTTVMATVKRYEDDYCEFGCGSGRPARRQGATPMAVPDMPDPDTALLPDLRALPAWGIGVDNRKRGSFLRFGANVWTAGAGDLVVEGFREDGAEVMDAYQYFYSNGTPVGRSQVGQMEFDNRRGHNHWHFLQFARYSLLGDSLAEPVRSKKEAFCLAPTDAIDLTIPDARMRPQIGLGTACGNPDSVWIREILPLGWGDTYYQSRPGQSFNITDLPNGTYYIEVEANPETDGSRNLFEQNYENNTELREVQLKGKAGARFVVVPPWNGIDTEGGVALGHH